jgi:hypothetical protein
MAYAKPTSPWACATLLVPNPGPSKFRFTVDLRPVNRFTVKHQFPMPNIEQELTRLSGSKFYATFDLCHGYWQLPLADSSQACQSFITPDAIFSPTRVLHGTTNAVTYIQAPLATIIPPELRQHQLYWLEDILTHSDTPTGLIPSINAFFDVCVKFNLKLHPTKCVLFSKYIRVCGRHVSAEGIRLDHRRLDGIVKMEPPVMAPTFNSPSVPCSGSSMAYRRSRRSFVRSWNSWSASISTLVKG